MTVDASAKDTALSATGGDVSAPQDFQWVETNIPCQHACPAHTDIPEYLEAISRGEFAKAYRINLEDNVFPAVLGRVCSRPCEPVCRHGWQGLGEPVAICFSKRSASAFMETGDPVVLKPVFPSSGKRVAVIGAGPAGLTAARQLALYGHDVTVYEKHGKPGGMMIQGIPPFRLPREVVEREIRQVELTGVAIHCNKQVGRDISVSELLDRYDAVVLAAGTLKPNIPPIDGNNLEGTQHGLSYLIEVNEFARRETGRNVVVVGGGFTAVDCARTALRLGAEGVKVFYRRSQKEMLVTPGEYEELLHEGISMEFMAMPKGLSGSTDALEAIRFSRTRLGEADAQGRRTPIEIDGSEFDVPVDHVLFATGQWPDTSWIDDSLRKDLVVDNGNLASGISPETPVTGLFAAGDYACGASTMINAIGHAKKTARAVDYFLMGKRRLEDVVSIEDGRQTDRSRELDFIPRQQMPTVPLGERAHAAEVESGFDRNSAIEEAKRCYLCHYKYEIDMDKCIYCDQCREVKPQERCIVRPSKLIRDEQGRIVDWENSTDDLAADEQCIYWINQNDCIRCNACLEVCPVDCISVQKVSLCTKPCA